MEIQRHNIFDLIGERQATYHSAILTSYTFDPIFFESFYLPRLRQCGVSNVVVLLDASSYDRILSCYPSFGLQSDRRLYTLIRQTPTGSGVFHPKMTVLFGEDTGMLVVGSGNLTYSGQAINEEVWNTFSLKGAESDYLPLFRRAWEYLNGLLPTHSILLNQQIKWITDNVNWLSESPSVDNVNIDRQQFMLLANDSEGSILSKLRNIVGDEEVKSITTISPFYDISGLAVKSLYDCFMPGEINCIYSEEGTYPYDLIKEQPHWLTLFSWHDVYTSKKSVISRLHAKIIQLELVSRTILISGSANVTGAALNGNNDETCIAIISNLSDNHIKDLGVVLDRHSVAPPTKLEMLRKPERTSTNSIDRTVQILSAELIDDTFVAIINGSYKEDFRLLILDSHGRELQVCTPRCNNGKLVMESVTPTGCMAVIINPDDLEISNRCFIINDEDVSRFNPNKVLRKLDSLLESSRDWKDNLSGILSYLWFDDRIIISKTHSLKSTTSTIPKEVIGKVVSSEDYDNIVIGGRYNVLSLPDVRIIDYLLSSEKCTKGGMRIVRMT